MLTIDITLLIIFIETINICTRTIFHRKSKSITKLHSSTYKTKMLTTAHNSYNLLAQQNLSSLTKISTIVTNKNSHHGHFDPLPQFRDSLIKRLQRKHSQSLRYRTNRMHSLASENIVELSISVRQQNRSTIGSTVNCKFR